MFDIALMPVTGEWLPYENLLERELIRQAVAEERQFVKGLRVDLEASQPIASITLSDTLPQATAIHFAPEADTDESKEAAGTLLATGGVEHYAWSPGTALPARKLAERKTAVFRGVHEPITSIAAMQKLP